jgi:glycosyltransferase involved in cell wall biosynthesis
MLHRHAPKTSLHLHTEAQADHGWDLKQICERFGVDKVTNTLSTGIAQTIEQIPDPVVKAVFDQMHLMVLPTMGESFCLTALEAMACGVPVLATDCSAIPELLPKENLIGVSSSIILPWDNASYSLADVEHMYDLMQHLYSNKGALERASEEAIEIAKKYSWSKCIDGWKSILTGLDIPEQKGDVLLVNV